ncbi:MAG: extracellular solute-binding protein, partial [Agathobacter sp.]
MKKRFTKLAALLLASAMLFTACNGNAGNQGNTTGSLEGTYDITVWVSETAGVKELTEQQIAKFCAANPGLVINATIEGVTEADSATNMINDVESGADLYCFAQDQLARLVAAGALAELGQGAAKTVTEANDAGAVKAASVGGKLYCYPLTSDNGYYMYYDKSVIKESSLDSLEAIIADCEAAGKLFSFELETSAWYNASFFFATGCVSEWTTDSDANFTSVNDTFNSDAGLIALKGMQKLLKSKAYNSSSGVADFLAATPSAVVISGPWASADAQKALGDNYGATDLPSFEVDGKSYHLGSFSGNKLMGVKPQTDAAKQAVLQQ